MIVGIAGGLVALHLVLALAGSLDDSAMQARIRRAAMLQRGIGIFRVVKSPWVVDYVVQGGRR